MKKLILMRHAKAEKEAASGEDFDRPLSEKGRIDAKKMAQALQKLGLSPDLCLVSSAMRTRETFAGFEGLEATFSKDLYNADAPHLRRAIEAAEDDHDTILLIAHNPGVQILALTYLIEGAAAQPDIELVRGAFEPATACVFDVDVAGRPTLDRVLKAKDL